MAGRKPPEVDPALAPPGGPLHRLHIRAAREPDVKPVPEPEPEDEAEAG